MLMNASIQEFVKQILSVKTLKVATTVNVLMDSWGMTMVFARVSHEFG